MFWPTHAVARMVDGKAAQSSAASSGHSRRPAVGLPGVVPISCPRGSGNWPAVPPPSILRHTGGSRVANQKLDALKEQVQGNSKAIETLTQVSYSGWTTAQKIQAVESGLFPD